MDKSYLINHFISILVICNPATAIPVFLALTKGKSLEEKRRIGLSAGLAVGVILLTVTWLGSSLLDLISVRVATFQVTGGLILLLLALSILNAQVGSKKSSKDSDEIETHDSITVVPLAIPLMAGPGAISAVIVASDLHPSLNDRLMLSVAALAVTVTIGTLLYFATNIENFLGKTGLTIVGRVGGLVLAAIAVENIARGISGLYGC